MPAQEATVVLGSKEAHNNNLKKKLKIIHLILKKRQKYSKTRKRKNVHFNLCKTWSMFKRLKLMVA